MLRRAWQWRLAVLSVIAAAHWMLLGTLPIHGGRAGFGTPVSSLAATTVSIYLPPSLQVRAAIRPIASHEVAQSNRADTPANTPPQPASSDATDEGLYGVSGMLEDDLPIVLTTPKPARLRYDSKGETHGVAYASSGVLLWEHDGNMYNARMDMVDVANGMRRLRSSGNLLDGVLTPLVFEDSDQNGMAVQLNHVAGKVHRGPLTAEADFLPGAQDQLSVLIQLATIFAGNSDRLPAGSALAFQVVGVRSVERWVFNVVGVEPLVLPTGPVNTIRLTREPGTERDVTLDLWLAPETGYLPVRIRLSHRDGNSVEQALRAVESP